MCLLLAVGAGFVIHISKGENKKRCEYEKVRQANVVQCLENEDAKSFLIDCAKTIKSVSGGTFTRSFDGYRECEKRMLRIYCQ